MFSYFHESLQIPKLEFLHFGLVPTSLCVLKSSLCVSSKLPSPTFDLISTKCINCRDRDLQRHLHHHLSFPLCQQARCLPHPSLLQISANGLPQSLRSRILAIWKTVRSTIPRSLSPSFAHPYSISSSRKQVKLLVDMITCLANGRYYPRDIGCSSSINGFAVYQFGDTFAHDAESNFVTVSCSNASLVTDLSKPQLSAYCGIKTNGEIPVNPPLLPGEGNRDDHRTTTWCFGGIVFSDTVRDGTVVGYTYFQNSHIVRSHPISCN